MGTWLTLAELKDRYSTSRIDSLSGSDDDVAEEAIVDAEGRAESKLLTRYASGDLPTSTATASPTLKRVVAKLALYYLHERHEIVADEAERIRDDALAEIRDICSGRQSLSLSGSPAVDRSDPVLLTAARASSLGSALSLSELEEM